LKTAGAGNGARGFESHPRRLSKPKLQTANHGDEELLLYVDGTPPETEHP
jgi:hypothetical protein